MELVAEHSSDSMHSIDLYNSDSVFVEAQVNTNYTTLESEEKQTQFWHESHHEQVINKNIRRKKLPKYKKKNEN